MGQVTLSGQSESRRRCKVRGPSVNPPSALIDPHLPRRTPVSKPSHRNEPRHLQRTRSIRPLSTIGLCRRSNAINDNNYNAHCYSFSSKIVTSSLPLWEL